MAKKIRNDHFQIHATIHRKKMSYKYYGDPYTDELAMLQQNEVNNGWQAHK
jgi:hypothetical protein